MASEGLRRATLANASHLASGSSFLVLQAGMLRRPRYSISRFASVANSILAAGTEGFTGADLRGLCQAAGLSAFRRGEDGELSLLRVCDEDFRGALHAQGTR